MFDLIGTLVVLVVTWLIGTIGAKRHLARIRDMEQKLSHIHVFAAEQAPPQAERYESKLVMASVVVSLDYFRRFVESLMQLVGGRMRFYENLLDRARREAMIRLKQEAAEIGAKRIFNVELQTAHVFTRAKNGEGSFEIIIYGTALVPRSASKS